MGEVFTFLLLIGYLLLFIYLVSLIVRFVSAFEDIADSIRDYVLHLRHKEE
jgi:thiosulfate reductase cytochrome b subunit